MAFGKTDINIDMIIMAEKFLVKCIDSKANSESFDDLRMEYYHHHNNFNLEKILRVITSIFKEHFSRVIFGIIHAFVKFPLKIRWIADIYLQTKN